MLLREALTGWLLLGIVMVVFDIVYRKQEGNTSRNPEKDVEMISFFCYNG